MAIYHLTAKVISRGKGQSAIAAAAYRSGERLRDEQTGELKSYQLRLDRIVLAEIMAPKDAPEWARDRNTLWNNAERAENRKDAQLAREIEIGLPHELTAQQREWLVKDFAREAFVRAGYVVDIAIHAPDKNADARNHHAHLMVTRRTIGPEGFSAKKDWQFDPKQLERWREQWEHLANRHLERHGHAARIDRRSLKARGIDREPDIHLGYAAAEIARRGGESERIIQLDDIRKANAERAAVKGEIRELDRELQGLEQEQAAARKAEEKRQREQAEQEAARRADEQRRQEQAAQREAQEARQRESAALEAARKAEIERQEKVKQEATRKAGIDREQAAQREAAAQAEEARKIEIVRAVATEMIERLNGRTPSAEDYRKALQAIEERLARANAPAAKEPVKAAEKATPTPAPAPTPARDRTAGPSQEPQRGAAETPNAAPLGAKKEKAVEVPARVVAAPDPRQAAQAALERLARAPSVVPQREPVAKSLAPAAPIHHPPTLTPKEAARTATNAAVSAGKTMARGGLMVADKVSGKVMGLADFVTDFLGGSSSSERPQVEQNRAGAAAFLNHPQGRMQRQMEQLAAEQRAALAERAWETIREDMQAGRALKSEEVRNLPRQALEQIRQFGDEAVRQMVQEAEKRAERYWKGEERERERDW